jgi:hypothetical protein
MEAMDARGAGTSGGDAGTAKKRASAKTAPVEMRDVDEIIALRGLPRWTGESLKAYAGWKSGKQVTAAEFDAAYDGWLGRSIGGGRR